MTGYRFSSSGRYLPDASELLDLHPIWQSVDFHHINTRAPLGAPKKAVLPKKDGSMLQTTRVLLSDSQNRYSNTGQNSTQLERKINREVEIQLAIEA